MKLMIINGPNINMLEYRENNFYGTKSYQELKDYVLTFAKKNKFDAMFLQSNYEGEIVNFIHTAIKEKYDAIIINPAAYSHYSYAIYDALLIFKGIKVEVHLSDVTNRDEFRKKLVTSLASEHTISGYQENSYIKAIEYIIQKRTK